MGPFGVPKTDISKKSKLLKGGGGIFKNLKYVGGP
jgi:hypothetical protein